MLRSSCGSKIKDVFMKKFIINFGNGLIDLAAWVTLVALVITSIALMFSENFLYGIGVLLIGLVIFVATFYLIYLAISVNDNLEEIKCELKYKNHGNNND